jgi:hypothetical protein
MRIPCLALAAAISLVTDVAHACSAPTCTRAVVLPVAGNLPADRVRLRYFPSGVPPLDLSDDASVALPRMYRLEGTTKVNVPYELELDAAHGIWLTPTTEQPLGTQLVVETDAPGCGPDAPLRATYSITEKRPTLPTQLGTLTATTNRALIPIAVDEGACSEVADVAYADLKITLSDEAAPFSALWRYQLYVDDQMHGSFIDTSSVTHRLPQGVERIYAQCSGLDAGTNGTVAVRPGVHVVRITAQLGDERPLSTPDLQLELRCDGPAPTAPIDGGVSVTPSASPGGCSLTSHEGGTWLTLMLLALRFRGSRSTSGSSRDQAAARRRSRAHART